MIRRLLKIAPFTIVVLVGALAPTAYAANATDWQAGLITSDDIFFNSSTMSTGDIQNFLNAQVSSCDTWGQKIYSGSQTRAQRGASKGYSAPYVCLKDYQENPTTHETNLSTAGNVNGGWSAAQIIKYAADTYGINPKALIVLLQKEQGLVTDDWPWSYQYRSATGYGCPDTAPCDSEYYGFYNQVTNAAAAFKRYATKPQSYRYKAYQNNDILYNPSSSCGSSSVYLQNQATAGLYIYTPYQPNQAALNNLYGTGDSCSSYGNRNFWRMYTDWFGSPVGVGYSLSATVSPSATIMPNEIITGVQVTLRNLSGETWYSDDSTPVGQHPVRLAMRSYEANPYANPSDPAWLGTNNQIKMDQQSVSNGGLATFTFSLKGPVRQINNYVMNFVPVKDGVGFYRNIGMQWILSTPSPNLSYQVTSQQQLPETSTAGEINKIKISIKNNGNVTWYGDAGSRPIGSAPTRLYTLAPAYHISTLACSDGTWLASNQISLSQARVNPGETADFIFNTCTPVANGSLVDNFGIIIDGITPYPVLAPIKLSTSVNDYKFEVVSNTLPDKIQPGQRYTAKIVLKNTGKRTWYADGNVPENEAPFRLASSSYSPYKLVDRDDASWLGTNNQIKMTSSRVSPGGTGEFIFSIIAPYNSSSFTSLLRPVLDGKFFLDDSLRNQISIPSMVTSYSTTPGSMGPPGVMSPGETVTVKLNIKNETNYVWYADGSTPRSLNGGAMRIVMYDPWYRTSPFANTSDPSWLQTASQIRMQTAIVKPGEIGTFEYTYKAPSLKGRYVEKFSLAIDGYALLPYVGMQFNVLVQ